MKKIFLTLALACFVSATAFAQDLKFGLKGGANISNMDGKINAAVLNLNLKGNSVVNYHVGAMAHIGISDRFALQPEILYNTQGTLLKDNMVVETLLDVANLQDGDIEFQLDYISIPIWAKLYPAEGFALMIAPQANILINSNEVVNAGGLSSEVEVINSYNDIDFGINLGAQYEFDMGLTLGASYYLGASDVLNSGVIQDVRHKTFQISAGWYLF